MWSAALGWLVLTGIVIVYVVVFDIHAGMTHGPSLSHQFHVWLLNPRIAPFIFGSWIGVFVGLTFHWFEYKGR